MRNFRAIKYYIIMKKLLFVLFLLTASYEGISAKKITKRFYGSEAVQSDVNPCAGPTIRVCGEIEIDEITTVTPRNGNYRVTIKRYDEEGNVSSQQTYVSYVDFDVATLELLTGHQANVEYTTTEDDIDF